MIYKKYLNTNKNKQENLNNILYYIKIDENAIEEAKFQKEKRK